MPNHPAFGDSMDRRLKDYDEAEAFISKYEGLMLEGDPPPLNGYLLDVPTRLRGHVELELRAIELEPITPTRSVGKHEGAQDAVIRIETLPTDTPCSTHSDEKLLEFARTILPLRFSVKRLAGRGGMGFVVVADDDACHILVAIKLPYARNCGENAATTLDDFSLAAQFLAGEAIQMQACAHPHVVPVLYSSTTPVPHFAMPYYVRGSLRTLMPEFEGEVARSVAMIADICHAIDAIHSRGLIHRDIKPENILFSGNGRPLVADFGLAISPRDASLSPYTAGTHRYMSPEQRRHDSQRMSHSSDVYSLGIMLLELLGTELPNPDDSEWNSHSIEALTFDQNVPEDLQAICLIAISSEPECRFASAAAMARALEQWNECTTLHTEDGPESHGFPLVPGPLSREHEQTLIESLPHPNSHILRSLQFFATQYGPAVGILHGLSGVGKSSLVNAGLIPRITREHQVAVTVIDARTNDIPDVESYEEPHRRYLVVCDHVESWLLTGQMHVLQSLLERCSQSNRRVLLLIRNEYAMELRQFVSGYIRTNDDMYTLSPLSLKYAANLLQRIRRTKTQQLGDERANTYIQTALSLVATDRREVSFASLVCLDVLLQNQTWDDQLLAELSGSESLGESFMEHVLSECAKSSGGRFRLPVLHRAAMVILTQLAASAVSRSSLLDSIPRRFVGCADYICDELENTWHILELQTMVSEDESRLQVYRFVHDSYSISAGQWVRHFRSHSPLERVKEELRRAQSRPVLGRLVPLKTVALSLVCVREFWLTEKSGRRFMLPSLIAYIALLISITSFLAIGAVTIREAAIRDYKRAASASLQLISLDRSQLEFTSSQFESEFGLTTDDFDLLAGVEFSQTDTMQSRVSALKYALVDDKQEQRLEALRLLAAANSDDSLCLNLVELAATSPSYDSLLADGRLLSQSEWRAIALVLLAGAPFKRAGGIRERDLDETSREEFLEYALEHYCRHPSAFVHAAARYTLIQHGRGQLIPECDQLLRSGGLVRGREWYVNSVGDTLVLHRIPETVTTGSRESEVGRRDDEHRREHAGGYTIAAEMTETPFWLRDHLFQQNIEEARREPMAVVPDRPYNDTMYWNETAHLCTTLDEIEQVPEGNRCYVSLTSGQAGKADYGPVANVSTKDGYRLLQAFEWEAICRGDTSGARFFGNTSELMEYFIWNPASAYRNPGMSQSVYPSPNGMCDMLGSLQEWTYTVYQHSDLELTLVDGTKRPIADYEMRGGSYDHQPFEIRSAARFRFSETHTDYKTGMRYCRTLVPRRSFKEVELTITCPARTGTRIIPVERTVDVDLTWSSIPVFLGTYHENELAPMEVAVNVAGLNRSGAVSVNVDGMIVVSEHTIGNRVVLNVQPAPHCQMDRLIEASIIIQTEESTLSIPVHFRVQRHDVHVFGLGSTATEFREYNFETIVEGTHRETHFTFRNDGTIPVAIEEWTAPEWLVGVTSNEFGRRMLRPGEVEEYRVAVDSAERGERVGSIGFAIRSSGELWRSELDVAATIAPQRPVSSFVYRDRSTICASATGDPSDRLCGEISAEGHIVSGNMDDDTTVEIVHVVEDGEGLRWRWHSSSGQETREARFGRKGDTVPGPLLDWNSDGLADLCVVRVSSDGASLSWLIDSDRDGSPDQQLLFGDTETVPVVGDWDGDGIADVGVFVPLSGSEIQEWRLRRRDGSVQMRRFGMGNSQPLTGDWDGDGKYEIGCVNSRPDKSGATITEVFLDMNSDPHREQQVRIGVPDGQAIATPIGCINVSPLSTMAQ